MNLPAPQEVDDFMVARPGDNILVPFECDYCSFYRLTYKEPDMDLPMHMDLLNDIRRVNLDAFWTLAPSTVANHMRNFWEQVGVGKSKGFEMFPVPLGPFPAQHDQGMRAAIAVLAKGEQPGRHETKVKFSTARKQRSLHTKISMASVQGGALAPKLLSERGSQALVYIPTNSEFFLRFISGYKSRVGIRTKQDAPISIQLMVEIQARLESDWQEAIAGGNKEETRDIAEVGAYLLLTYCRSMRGFEATKAVLTRLRCQMLSPAEATRTGREEPPHVSLPLVGRFKARSRETQQRLIDIAWETASGLQPGLWTQRLVQVLESLGITSDWVFQDEKGHQRPMSHFSDFFFKTLLEIQEECPSLISADMNVLEDFGLARSARRGASTRAKEAGVDKDDIDWMNRWNIGEDDVVRGPMRVQYAERKQMLQTFLRFSLPL